MKKGIYFVTGIDTGIGKSVAVGFIAKEWNKNGISTVTQKFIQTGNTDVSEDIIMHREIMGVELSKEDAPYVMPEIYSFPASPHLAAKLENRPVDLEKISNATNFLIQKYDAVLIEGAGGIMVPISENYLTIDYISEKKYPIILVTSGRLGSINHTLLTLDAIRRRNLSLYALVYNRGEYPIENETIQNDTESYLKDVIAKDWTSTQFMVLPRVRHAESG